MATLSARSRRPVLVLGVLVVVCLVVMVLHVFVGDTYISPANVLSLLAHPSDPDYIVWGLRLPRMAYCVVAGASLGLVGSTFQAIFRNPLADPYIVGVSSGAAAGGAIGIVTGFGAGWTGVFDGLGPAVLATLGGVLTLGLVLTLSVRRGIIEIQSMLITGVVIGSLLSSLLSLIMLWGGKNSLILSWLLGHMTPAEWNHLLPMAITLSVAAPILFFNGRRLNALAIGDDAARQVGVDVDRVRPMLLIVGAVMVSVVVANVGIIGFLGLISPHLARRILGVDWRWSLIGSGIIGAALLCGADIEASRVIRDAEVPVGIVTAIIGAPFLIFLMRRAR